MPALEVYRRRNPDRHRRRDELAIQRWLDTPRRADTDPERTDAEARGAVRRLLAERDQLLDNLQLLDEMLELGRIG